METKGAFEVEALIAECPQARDCRLSLVKSVKVKVHWLVSPQIEGDCRNPRLKSQRKRRYLFFTLSVRTAQDDRGTAARQCTADGRIVLLDTPGLSPKHNRLDTRALPPFATMIPVGQ